MSVTGRDGTTDGFSGCLKGAHADGRAALVVVSGRLGVLQLNISLTRKVHAVLATAEPGTIGHIIIEFILLVRTVIEGLGRVKTVIAFLFATDRCHYFLLYEIIVLLGLHVVDTPGTENLIKTIDTMGIGKRRYIATQGGLIVVFLVGAHQVVDSIAAAGSATGTTHLLCLVVRIEPLGGSVGLQSRFAHCRFHLDALLLGRHIAILIRRSDEDVIRCRGCTAVISVVGKDNQFGNSLLLAGSTPVSPCLDVGDAGLEAGGHVRLRCRIADDRAHNANAVVQHQLVLRLCHLVGQLLHEIHQMGIVRLLYGEIASAQVYLGGLKPLL